MCTKEISLGRPSLLTIGFWTSSLQNRPLPSLKPPDSVTFWHGSPRNGTVLPSCPRTPLLEGTCFPWNVNKHFTGLPGKKGSSPSSCGLVPCLRTFYCRFLSVDLIVGWHCRAGCQHQRDILENKSLLMYRGGQERGWSHLQECSFSQQPMFTWGHLQEYKK